MRHGKGVREMFEQDYIMRLIKEMVRAVLKLLFRMEAESPNALLIEDAEKRCALETLLDMVEEGKINAAENQLYEMLLDGDMDSLEMALLFYSYLNEKSDDFLMEHNFNREEIKLGIEGLMSRYGLSGMAEAFLPEAGMDEDRSRQRM